MVEYFALLAQEAKVNQESVSTLAETLGEFFNELKDKRSFSLSQPQVRAAINRQLVTNWNTPITDGDHILLIPPLVGG